MSRTAPRATAAEARAVSVRNSAPGRLSRASRRLPEESRRFQARRHVRELELDRLVLRDRLPERDSLLRVREGGVERGARHAAGAGRDVDAADLENAEDLRKATAQVADQVGGRDAVV